MLYEVITFDTDLPVPDDVGRLIVTTLGIDGSPLVRFETGDVLRSIRACACGATDPGVVVLGRHADELVIAGRSLYARNNFV